MNILPFLNREREKSRLTKRLRGKKAGFLVLYGRRRCGKSRLLREVLSKGDVYFAADRQDRALQIADLARQISTVIPGFDAPVYPTWDALFTAFFHRAKKGSTLALDEFPYLVGVDPTLPSVLQKKIDEGLPVNLVICGSSQKMMQGMVLDSSEPLYGRSDEIVKLAPLEPGWIVDALGVSGQHAIESYAVFGGIPRYWEVAKEHKSMWAALESCVFDRNGILYDEPRRVLSDDLGDTAQPASILKCVALGAERLTEIAARLGKPASSLSRPLQNLIELGYLKRDLPFGEHPSKSKQSLYKVADPFLLFWYRYVHPHRSMLELDKVSEILGLCQKTFNQHVSEIWERISRDAMVNLNLGGISWCRGERWWSKASSARQCEFDVVASALDKSALFVGEAKWREKTDFGRTLLKLKENTEVLEKHIGDRKVVYGIFAKKKPEKSWKGCRVITPEDLLATLR
jgi:AAA+ ATPase superfamily predicted ATPase